MLKKLNEIQIGGNKDTICITLVLLPIIMITPLFYSTKIHIFTTFLSFIGMIGISYRLLDEYRRAHKLETSTKFKSSPPPVNVDIYKSYEIGYTSDTAVSIRLYFEIMTRHIMIIGQSGTGKSVLVRNILFQHALQGGGLMHIDGKNDQGDFLKFYSLMCSIGRGDDVLVVNIDFPELSNTYNPILYGDPDEVATRIISLIPSSENNPGSDHYRTEATVALTIFVGALQQAGLAYSMIDLALLLMSDKALMELDERLSAIDEYHEAAINFKTLLSKFIKKGRIDGQALKDMFGGVGGRIFMLGTNKFGEITNNYNPDIKLFDVITQNKILWVMLPTLGKTEAANAFGKILVSDLRTAVSWVLKLPESKKPSPLFLASMDEAGSYVNDSWGRLFEQARSARIVMMPAVQTDANYKKISPELLSIVEGNSWSKIYLKVGDLDTAERIVKNIGTTKSIKYTLTNTESNSQSKQNLQVAPNATAGDGTGQSYGHQESDVDIITAPQIEALGIGECILTVGGREIYHLQMPMVNSEHNHPFQVNRLGVDIPEKGLSLKLNYKKYIDVVKLQRELSEEDSKYENLDRPIKK
ncbi:MAG: TraM recognition domain-containing protein [Burkholderiales bacterium]|nr:TraM recognition domain-containing protein [Burkholderiales bacterium]